MFLTVMSVALSGCGMSSHIDSSHAGETVESAEEKNETSIDDHQKSTEEEKETEDVEEVVEDNDGSVGTIPEWLMPLSDLNVDDKVLYYEGRGEEFYVDGNKLMIPECNIMIGAKKIDGHDLEGITINDDVLEIMSLLGENNIIDEKDVHDLDWVGLSYEIVFLTTNSRYYLMEFTITEQNIAYIRITKDDDTSFTFFMESSELCDKIKKSAEYKLFDTKKSSEISNIIVIVDDKNYTLTEKELSIMKKILMDLEQKTMLCQGPYDVSLKADMNGETVNMKWCNDDCGIIAVEGACYQVSSEDEKWIRDLIDKCK